MPYRDLSTFTESDPESPRMKTAYYTGDGSDDRTINIGVDLNNATYVLVLLFSDYSADPAAFTNENSLNNAPSFGGGLSSNTIQQLNATGFEVGSSGNSNYNGTTYYAMVIYEE